MRYGSQKSSAETFDFCGMFRTTYQHLSGIKSGVLHPIPLILRAEVSYDSTPYDSDAQPIVETALPMLADSQKVALPVGSIVQAACPSRCRTQRGKHGLPSSGTPMSVSNISVQPLFNPADEEWVVMTGRYILNMGVIEAATRLLIIRIEGTDTVPIYSGELAARIGFIRKRFPRADAARHKWAMNSFEVAMKHTTFRNIVAHSPLVMTGHADGSIHIGGIMNVTPKSPDTLFDKVSLEELKGRVDESAAVARRMLEMQADFS